jgi:hypothetical protein
MVLGGRPTEICTPLPGRSGSRASPGAPVSLRACLAFVTGAANRLQVLVVVRAAARFWHLVINLAPESQATDGPAWAAQARVPFEDAQATMVPVGAVAALVSVTALGVEETAPRGMLLATACAVTHQHTAQRAWLGCSEWHW